MKTGSYYRPLNNRQRRETFITLHQHFLSHHPLSLSCCHTDIHLLFISFLIYIRLNMYLFPVVLKKKTRSAPISKVWDPLLWNERDAVSAAALTSGYSAVCTFCISLLQYRWCGVRLLTGGCCWEKKSKKWEQDRESVKKKKKTEEEEEERAGMSALSCLMAGSH